MENIAPALLNWFYANRRILPFREDPTPYHVWLSEIMLQQTRVSAALPYYERFLAALPDIPALAGCEEEKLHKLWEGLGYYSRVRNLQKAAKIVCAQYGGQLPADYNALLALPGIGEYTAGAIASISFGLPVPAVDGNVLRVFSRLYADGEQRLAALSADKSRADADSAQYELRLTALREQINRKYEDKETLFRAFTTADTKLTGLRAEKEKLDAKLHEDYDMTLPEAQTMAEAMHWEPVTPENRREVLATQTDCRNRLRALGHFDPDAVEKYKEVYERCEAMRTQIADLEKSRAELTGIIARLEDEMKVAFATAFDAINENFGKTFAELFGGGSAEVSLTDPDNILESGIEIKAAPPGKIIKSLMQLSGGEQAFVGVALFFAILKVNPTPFCILDEIEAALDEVNVERLAQYIRRYADETQFIMITHRRGTMAAATRLYGVTMPEHGISKVLTLDVADISKNKEGSWNGLFN